MVPDANRTAPPVRAYSELSYTLQGSVPPRRSDGTCAAGANATDLLHDDVVSVGVTLHSDNAVEVIV